MNEAFDKFAEKLNLRPKGMRERSKSRHSATSADSPAGPSPHSNTTSDRDFPEALSDDEDIDAPPTMTEKTMFRYTEDSDQSGWLLKRCGVLRMKEKRFIRVEAQTLMISKTDHIKEVPYQIYSLSNAKVTGDEKGHFGIKVGVSSIDMALLFYASNKKDFEHWLNVFKRSSGAAFEEFYIKGKKLGAGSFGAVFLCEDKNTKEKLALKTISKTHANEKQMEYILRELHIMRTMVHPNIVQTIDIFDTRKEMMIVMELAAGGTLHDILEKNGSFREEHVRMCTRDILRGIKYLHDRQVVHRDIKLKNILVMNSKFPLDCKLADFGLSNYVGVATLSREQLESTVGSPHYVAPEIITGEKYGKYVDMWSVGIMFYNMLTGMYPFAGDTLNETLELVASGRTDWENYLKELSPEAVDMCYGLLERDPQKRLTVDQALDHKFMKMV